MFLTPDELKYFIYTSVKLLFKLYRIFCFVCVYLKYIDNYISKIWFRYQLHTLKTISLMITNFVTHQQLEYNMVLFSYRHKHSHYLFLL